MAGAIRANYQWAIDPNGPILAALAIIRKQALK
jgi:hypothetical protein